MNRLFDDLSRLLDDLARRDEAEQIDLLTLVAGETGGHVKLPKPGDTWDSQRIEITAHGIFADGGSLSEALRNWTAAARRMAGRAA